MKGHKRFKDGAWRLIVHAGADAITGTRRNIYETVRAPNSRAGLKLADARLAQIIALVEAGRAPDRSGPSGPTVAELAERWQRAHRPRLDEKTGRWRGWSPKTAKTTADNFRLYILPSFGTRPAAALTGVLLDDLYEKLEDVRGLSPSVVARCHGQIRAMYSWAVRKRLVTQNPALAADTVTVRRADLRVPAMDEVRAVQNVATADFAAYVQLAATVGARRGTMVALRSANIDLANRRVTFTKAIAEGINGQVEKGTKADRPYAVSLGETTCRVLAEHLGRSAERAHSLGIEFGPKSFVFSDDGGSTHWNLSWPSHAWRRYASRSGIDGVRLHDLRHTAASQMLMGGVPISIVAERLGCTEANILRTYRHFVPGSDSAAADLMDGLLSGERSQVVGAGSSG